MSKIQIGNNNKIIKSTIGDVKNVEKKHSVIIGIIVSVITGVILMFNFWNKIVSIIEKFVSNLF